jgi:hypothetical protein
VAFKLKGAQIQPNSAPSPANASSLFFSSFFSSFLPSVGAAGAGAAATCIVCAALRASSILISDSAATRALILGSSTLTPAAVRTFFTPSSVTLPPAEWSRSAA